MPFPVQHLCLVARAYDSTLFRPALVVDVKLGLGSRLRALSSAIAASHALARTLIVVWSPDEHCDAKFQDLFVPPVGVEVIDSGSLFQQLIIKHFKTWQVVDAFEVLTRLRALKLGVQNHVYITTAFSLSNIPLWHYHSDNIHLRYV